MTQYIERQAMLWATYSSDCVGFSSEKFVFRSVTNMSFFNITVLRERQHTQEVGNMENVIYFTNTIAAGHVVTGWISRLKTRHRDSYHPHK